ncbi:ribosome maturation factor RimM [Rufibacter glacialis]|uniref:Ribosome maturation factor RimM n=1 Tax=Rufibacter glacialis TaxID=1259555 RepID=A0A5M8QMH3_9BACT|nr:ribosome maturation factor RimM [Rufibacter glacialis]KAA6437417.1 16S rRNA processing protein RimM [Rufibacter glacialis]GGK59417.1 ribosome maturation factor RimM [Rufibacter glacialis]
MTLDACFQLGYIVKAHGTKGQVVAFFDVDFPEEYDELESVFLLINGKLVPFFIDDLNPQDKGRSILKFEDVNTVADAEKLKGVSLYLPLNQLPELEEDQFYFHEVIGYTVVDKQLGELGTVQTFFDLPNQDLLAMEYQGHEVLIPVQDEIILRTSKEERRLYVNLPEGLLEVYTQPSNRQVEEPPLEEEDDDKV